MAKKVTPKKVKKSPTRKMNIDAGTGQTVSAETVKRRPKTTVTMTVSPRKPKKAR